MNFLSKQKPSNKWLVKDDNKKIIRAISEDVELPLDENNEMTMNKLIDFVRFSQDKRLNSRLNNKDYLRPAVGLAAPQIGVNKHMFYVRFTRKENNEIKYDEYAMVNCKILAKSSQIAYLNYGEGCLSVDNDINGIVPRSYKIIIEGYDWLTKKSVNMTLRGYKSIVFQHEIEHNFGKLYYDRINKEKPNFVDKSWIKI